MCHWIVGDILQENIKSESGRMLSINSYYYHETNIVPGLMLNPISDTVKVCRNKYY